MPRPRKKPYTTLASIQSPSSDSDPDACKSLKNANEDPSAGGSDDHVNRAVFSNWSIEECTQLIDYIKSNGFDGDMKKICERFPGHTETNIRHFMNALSEKGVTKDLETETKAAVLEKLQKEARTNSLSQSYGSILPTFVEWKAMFEYHPDPECCDGVDYAEIYRSIASLMRGEVPRALNKPTAEKFLDVFDDFLERVKEALPILPNESNTYKQPVGSTVKTPQQCNATLANRRSTKWTGSELLKGHVLITADLRQVREIYLTPAWANPFRYPDDVSKFRQVKIARRKKTISNATAAADGDEAADADDVATPVKRRRRRKK